MRVGLTDVPKDVVIQGTVYDGAVAASYARQWALSYNPAYRKFGADCTNFTSQALQAGGWRNKYGVYTSRTAWWYNALNQTYTWANADYWHDFTNYTKRGYVTPYVQNLELGDIVQIDFNNDTEIDHSMVVTSKDPDGTVYLSYHTTATLDRSIYSLFTDFPNATFYAFRITKVE